MFENLFENCDPIFHQFFVIKRRPNFFSQKSSLSSLDNTFLHSPCKSEQNRSGGIREMLTTAGGLAENGLSEKTTKLRHFWIFLLKNYMEASSINTLSNHRIKWLISLFV